MHESLSVRSPFFAGCPRHDSSQLKNIHRFYTFRNVFYVNGCSIKSACMIQVLDNHRIQSNGHLRGLNRCLSAYALLLTTSDMTLADLHAYFFRDVRARMPNASGMTLDDLHASITLKLQIELTKPQYVVYHPVLISYSVCRYYSIHCPPPVYTLSKTSRSCLLYTSPSPRD